MPHPFARIIDLYSRRNRLSYKNNQTSSNYCTIKPSYSIIKSAMLFKEINCDLLLFISFDNEVGHIDQEINCRKKTKIFVLRRWEHKKMQLINKEWKYSHTTTHTTFLIYRHVLTHHLHKLFPTKLPSSSHWTLKKLLADVKKITIYWKVVWNLLSAVV